jgi:outer membrane autotransporter protein
MFIVQILIKCNARSYGTTVAGVIHSTGAMTVTPANITVTDNNLFYNFTAATVSGAGNLDLIIAADANALPNAVAPNNPGATGVAQALQTIYNGGVPAGFQPVFDALATMTPQALNSALIELTPFLQGAGTQAGVSALHSMNKIIQSRVESVQGLNSGDETADQYAWARVFGNWGDQDDHSGVTGFESQTQGLAVGMDKPINDRIRAGGLLTYANTDLKSNLGSSKVNVDTYEIAGYGSYNIDPQTDINVQLDVGLNKANSTRSISFLGTTAIGDFDSFNWHLSGGIGHLFQLSDKTNLTPAMRIDYTHVKTDGYTEKGAGVLNQHVDSSSYEELLLTVDSKLSHKLTEDGLKFVANGSVGYDFINEQSQTTSTFTGGGPSYMTKGLDVSPWVYRGGLGLVKETGNGMEFSLRYDAEGRTSGYLNQTASVKVRWAF